ncbi:DUF6345 domain-containing protein [Acidobacteriota bacterium]
MARFGIEGIRYFSNARAAGINVRDRTYVFNNCNGLKRSLENSGHWCRFYHQNRDCWEVDMRDESQFGGIDSEIVEEVYLFYISSHGSNLNGNARINYDIAEDNWISVSDTWRLGDSRGVLNWLLIWGCSTIDRQRINSFWDVFQGLHMICGAWDSMVDSFTVDEAGEDIGNNLTDGKTVAESWIDGVSDWAVDNHPIVIAIENERSWNGGNYDWLRSTLDRDHLNGHGNTVRDILPDRKYWISYWWAEG